MTDEEFHARIKAFIETTNEHTRDGIDAGIGTTSIAKLLIAYGASLHMRDHGLAATRQLLRDQADNLSVKDG